MEDTSQEQDNVAIKTCKKAVKDCMQACKFGVYCEDLQIEMKAARAIAEDTTLSRETYVAAYKEAQRALISKPSLWSTTTQPSQILQAMKIAEELYDFDAAYAYIKDRVESAAIPQTQESEVTPS